MIQACVKHFIDRISSGWGKEIRIRMYGEEKPKKWNTNYFTVFLSALIKLLKFNIVRRIINLFHAQKYCLH